MASGPRSVLVDVLVAVVAGAGAAVFSVLTAFLCLVGGRLAIGVVLCSLTVSVIAAIGLSRRRRPAPSGTWAQTGRRIMMTALAVATMTTLAGVVANAVAAKPPGQATVAAAFHRHRGDFETLRDMVLADRLSSVIEGGRTYARESLIFRPPSELGIPSARAALYRERMKAAGCPRIDVWSDRSVHFLAASWGAANHGWRVSVVWSKTPLAPLVPKIDNIRDSPDVGHSAYSSIGDDWYVGIVW
jgi:hypothetical protein